MKNRDNEKNAMTCKSRLKSIPFGYCSTEEQQWKQYVRERKIENEKCEQWNRVVEKEASDWLPLTFMLCVSVAGVVSNMLEEEPIKVHMPNELQERTAGFFALGCGGSTEKTKHMMGQTFLTDKIVILLEIETDEGRITSHDTVISVSDEIDNGEIEDIPTAWLEIAPNIRWIKNRESALRILDTYHGEGGRCIPRVTRILKGWGEEKARDILRNEIEKFKISAKKKGLYQNIPEEFFKQIGLILVAYVHIPQELRIRSRGTERCSASN